MSKPNRNNTFTMTGPKLSSLAMNMWSVTSVNAVGSRKFWNRSKHTITHTWTNLIPIPHTFKHILQTLTAPRADAFTNSAFIDGNCLDLLPRLANFQVSHVRWHMVNWQQLWILGSWIIMFWRFVSHKLSCSGGLGSYSLHTIIAFQKMCTSRNISRFTSITKIVTKILS